MSFIRLALAIAGIAALGAPAAAIHSWSNYHWAQTSAPLQLTVNAAITSQWGLLDDGAPTGVFGDAINDWNRSSVLALDAKKSSTDRKRCNPITGQVLVCNYAYGFRGWLGIATVWTSGGHITKATTKLNDSYFNKAAYNTLAWRRLVMCQEIGHDFGLAHQDENFENTNIGSCMDYTDTPGEGAQGPSNEHPDQHDHDQLAIIYGHLDSTSTVINSASTNFGIREIGRASPREQTVDGTAGDSPAEWGRAIHFDGRGRPDVYVQELGGGRRKITHVFWALGEGPKGSGHQHEE